MSLLLIVAIAVAAGWFFPRKIVLIAPASLVPAYAVLVYFGRVGTDTPIVALAIVSEICVAGGIFARRHRATFAH
ncbi:MAG: hypothetical protein ABI995_08995 [Acidobacteriota bacterium]